MRGNNDGECRLSDGTFEYFGEVNNGFLLGIAKLVKWGYRRWVGEASVRALGVMMAASTEDVLGTGHWCGKNCTVLAVRSYLVLGT